MQIIVKILFVISALLFFSYVTQTYLDGYITKTVDVSIPYQEPIYKTLYSGILTYSFLGFDLDTPYSFKDANSYELKESWGWGSYNVIICQDSGCTPHLANGGYNEIQSYPSQIVIGNQTRYRIEPREVTKKRWDWLFS